MKNTYKEFHLLMILVFIFYFPIAKAQGDFKKAEIVKENTPVYFLIHHYIKENPIDMGIPHKLFCVDKKTKQKCVMFVGAEQVNNFLENKNCKKIYLHDSTVEYDCGGNAKKRITRIDEETHALFLIDYLLSLKQVKNNL